LRFTFTPGPGGKEVRVVTAEIFLSGMRIACIIAHKEIMYLFCLELLPFLGGEDPT